MTILNSVGTGESHGSHVPALPRTALWLTAYLVACLLGRIITVQPHSIVVVWPASGLALVWLASARTRNQLVIDTVLLSVSTALVIAFTDGSALQSVLALLSVVQTLVALWLIRRWVPHIWGGGGRECMSKLGDYGRILTAVAIGALTMAVLRAVLGLLLIPDEVVGLAVGRWGSNAAAMATVGGFGLLLGGWLTERRDLGLPAFNRPSRNGVLHGIGVTVSTLAIFNYGFHLNPAIPSTFMLTVTVVWCAIRFNLVLTAAHSLLTGTATVLFTILGYGPIAEVRDPETQALLAETFVVVLMAIGMTIALTRRQFFETIERLMRSETALATRAEELDMVMSHLEDGIAIIEAGGLVVHANAALLTAFGTREPQVFDRVPDEDEQQGEAFHPDGRLLEDADNPLYRAMAGETIEAQEIHHVDEEGVFRVLEVSALPMPNPGDAPQRVMIVLRDVTAARNYRESLVSFAGTVAHDLNNPLSVIDGWAEALEEDLGSSDSSVATSATPMVEHIRASVEQARGFISDLLAHSVARDQALACEPIALRNLVEHIAGTQDRPRHGGEIVAGDLLDVWADRVLLRQVLDNLIGNAFKYVAPGTTPRVLIEAQPMDDGWARVMLRDNGIGVPVNQRERIFETFHRASGGYPGTGLGLAICKRIIERHGGTIRVTANPDGVGSCFEFTLPMTHEALERATTS
jgi:signal transduction histidine kinase